MHHNSTYLLFLERDNVNTAKNTIISPEFLVWQLCLSAKFRHQEIGEITVFFAV